MEDVSKMKLLPKTHFRSLKGAGGRHRKVKEYEFKSRHLRVYAIQDSRGKLLVIGGFKNRQEKDLVKFRKLKDRYLDSCL